MEAEDVRRVMELLGTFPGTRLERVKKAADAACQRRLPMTDAEVSLVLMREVALQAPDEN